MKLDLRRLRHVVAVAETRSFSRAAEILSITQPALSRSIATLEEDFDLRIFDRGRAGVFITAAGEELIANAQRLLNQARGVEHNLQQLSAAEAGTVSFGMSPMVASIFLPRLLARVAATAPRLILKPQIRKAEKLLDRLARDQLEVCFFAEGFLPPIDTVVTKITHAVQFGIFTRAGHPLAGKHGLKQDDLKKYPFAASQAEIPGRPGQPSFLPTIVCENYPLMRELMLISDTICLTSALLLRPEILAGTATQLDIGVTTSKTYDLSMVQPAGRTLSPGTRLLAQAFALIEA